MYKNFICLFSLTFLTFRAFCHDGAGILSINTLAPRHILTDTFENPDSIPLETDMILRMFAFTEENK